MCVVCIILEVKTNAAVDEERERERVEEINECT